MTLGILLPSLRGLAPTAAPSSSSTAPQQPLQAQHSAAWGRRARLVAKSAADDSRRLDAAATAFSKGLAAGRDADDLVTELVGVKEDQYRDKLREKLAERAEELRREKEARQVKFTAGKQAYARGQYPASAALLEAALNEEGPFTQLGGEIQLWLALAYQACGREEDCIAVYVDLEKTHPIPAIRKQAADLRYIMEAPKLELSPDEKVQIPVLDDLEPNRSNRSAPAARPRPVGRVGGERRVAKSWDEEFWENYRPPMYLTNRYVWVASAVVATVLAYYSTYYKSSFPL